MDLCCQKLNPIKAMAQEMEPAPEGEVGGDTVRICGKVFGAGATAVELSEGSSELWHTMPPGSRVQALSKSGLWRECSMVKSQGTNVLMHYEGFDSKYDEWMDTKYQGHRIKAIGKKQPRVASPPKERASPAMPTVMEDLDGTVLESLNHPDDDVPVVVKRMPIHGVEWGPVTPAQPVASRVQTWRAHPRDWSREEPHRDQATAAPRVGAPPTETPPTSRAAEIRPTSPFQQLFPVGSSVHGCSGSKVWRRCTVTQHRNRGIRIHYDGFASE